MFRFIVECIVFFAITAASVYPLARVSRTVRRRFHARKWLRAAAIVAICTAGLGWSSRDLQQGCLKERNEGCIDVGGAGSQTLLIGGFVVVALVSAYMRYND